MVGFDIFGQIKKELQEFKDEKIYIAGSDNSENARYLLRENKGYFFSQYDTVNLIELYYNSKFETGAIDSEGQRKLFLNICAFRSDVASKMIDLDTKDFVFIPDDNSSKWGAWFIQKEFKSWARESYFGEFLNDLVENYPKYGTLVVKKVGKKLERVPLRTLVNQVDAKDLKTATHVIEIHQNMTRQDFAKYPDWDTKGLVLPFGQKTTVYERYGFVPAEFYYEQVKKACPESEKGTNIDVLTITTLAQNEKGDPTGSLLFIERVTERPYLEVHWKRQDGRWLGIGEVENQFENQIARNMIANLQRRDLLWSSKKMFQSPDSDVAKNLIKDVKDGDVLTIMPNGNITPIDMSSKNNAEFQQTGDIWEKNSDQKGFTYEVATGEALPSGTPFRLGVVLSNAVNSHFQMKREKLGLFLKKIVAEFVFPIFKKENSRAHTITVFGTEDGMNDLRKAASEMTFMDVVKTSLMQGEPIMDAEMLKQQIEEGFKNQTHLFVDIPDKFYDDVKHHIELTITGEEIDVAAKIASYTTLYQSLVQVGDPRASQILDKIMALNGDNLEAIIGALPPPQPMQVGQGQPQGGIPSPIQASQPQTV